MLGVRTPLVSSGCLRNRSEVTFGRGALHSKKLRHFAHSLFVISRQLASRAHNLRDNDVCLLSRFGVGRQH